MVLETHMKLCATARFFGKIHFAPKIGKMDQKWAKNKVFWNLLKNSIVSFC